MEKILLDEKFGYLCWRFRNKLYKMKNVKGILLRRYLEFWIQNMYYSGFLFDETRLSIIYNKFFYWLTLMKWATSWILIKKRFLNFWLVFLKFENIFSSFLCSENHLILCQNFFAMSSSVQYNKIKLPFSKKQPNMIKIGSWKKQFKECTAWFFFKIQSLNGIILLFCFTRPPLNFIK